MYKFRYVTVEVCTAPECAIRSTQYAYALTAKVCKSQYADSSKYTNTQCFQYTV